MEKKKKKKSGYSISGKTKKGKIVVGIMERHPKLKKRITEDAKSGRNSSFVVVNEKTGKKMLISLEKKSGL